MKAHTSETQATLTPKKAYQFLIEGNERFINNLRYNRNLLQQVNETTEGQWPFAIILSCIDSRTSAELIFDQGLGDIFSVRVAGNVINDDILGSMEYACEIANSKLLVVIGHSNCGAVKGACANLKMGNITTLLDKIQPAVEAVNSANSELDKKSSEFVESVAKQNVHNSIEEILTRSPILRGLVEQGKIAIVGGMYSVENGSVDFFEEIFELPAQYTNSISQAG